MLQSLTLRRIFNHFKISIAQISFDTADAEPSKRCRNSPRSSSLPHRAPRGARVHLEREQRLAPQRRTWLASLHAGPRPAPRGHRGCGKLYRARSRLYRNEILQENMRLKALAEIYRMHSFALLCTALHSHFFFEHFAKKFAKINQTLCK